MKFVDRSIRPALLSGALFAAAGLAAAPAYAEVEHRTSVVHNGQTVTLTYAPRLESRYQQIGVGPRATATCRWRTRIAVDRQATAGDGQPIAALSRTVETDHKRSGSRAGFCSNLTSRGKLPVVDKASLRPVAVEVAQADRTAVHAELASLDALSGSARHAR